MNYWPGTKIVKSQGNAFDWRGRTSIVTQDKNLKATNNAKAQAAGVSVESKKSFTIYSKARRLA